jgi:hypothetical protein
MPDRESYKKILNHNRIQTDLRRKMIQRISVLSLHLFFWGIFYSVMYGAFWHLLRHWAVHVVFVALGLVLLLWLSKLGYRIYTFARPLVGGRYTVVEDEIEYMKENAITGMHLIWRGRYLRWEPALENALFLKDHGKVLVDRWELKDHDGGDKIYLVIPEYNPRKILLYYNADHYEPGR